MHETTDMGHRALEYEDEYDELSNFEFGQLVSGDLDADELEDDCD